MKQHMIGLGIALGVALGIAAPTLAQQAVQWRVEDGGNGHWYSFVTSDPGTHADWQERASANGSHLATINVQGEQAFLAGLQPVGGQGILGGSREAKSDLYLGWIWVTGEPFTDSVISWAWGNPGCCGANEFWLGLWSDGVHDVGDDARPAAFWEWSADCNADGIVDYGQVQSRQLRDYDADNIPDMCEGPVSCLARAWGAGTTNPSVYPNYGQSIIPLGLTGLVRIRAGGYHTVAVRGDGTVVAWGRNAEGQLAVPIGLSNVVDVACGHTSTLALRTDGTLVAWGGNEFGESNVPNGLPPIARIASGYWHHLVLTVDGSVRAWGNNSWGQCTIPATIGTTRDLRAGRFHSVSLRANGTVLCWGYNGHGESAVPATVVTAKAIGAGNYHTLAVRSDGTVACWGNNQGGQCNVPPGLSNVIDVGGGEYHSAALQADGAVVCWGANTTIVNGNVPANQCVVPAGISGGNMLAVGGYHTLLAIADGDLDAVPDHEDNCDSQPNPLQGDCDSDGTGDACEIADGSPDVNGNGIPDTCDCPADINQSGTIDAEDLAYVLFAWGMPGGKAGDADINGDATVDANDLSLVLGSWGSCPE